MKTLPLIMVAPNGARRTKADHPALPVTIPQIVETAWACAEAGAGAIHAHVRDADQKHVLDAGLYRELLDELAVRVPAIEVQITTEAVGRYTPDEQRRLVRAVRPKAVSVALKEMLSDDDIAAATDFYRWAAAEGITVQHILYSPDEAGRLMDLVGDGTIPDGALQLLFVLGTYAGDRESDPAEIDLFLDRLGPDGPRHDWGVCAFGPNETRCLVHAVRRGGKARIGFENSLVNADGMTARDNAERVRELAGLLNA